MIKTTLLKIGLSEKEVDFYLLVLKHQEITASEIAKLSRESRTHIYDTLNKLIEKSFISYVIKNNIKYFKAVNPNKILDYLKEKEARIKEEEKDILNILPQLNKFKNSVEKDKTEIEIFEGKEGLKTIMNDILREGKEIVTWGATSKIKEYFPDFFIERYLNERKKKKIRARQLFTDFSGVLESSVSENRKLPKEFASPTTTIIYGNKVTIWFWTEIPKVILIENKDLANSYKKHFELMWESVK